jgi:flagellar motor switch protein FliG
MKFILSSLSRLFQGDKKRHNNTDKPLTPGQKLSQAEFMRIYEAMPERARAQLYSSLTYKQKVRLLELLSAGNAPQKAEPADTSEWRAEDFLPVKDERKVAKLRHLREVKEVRAQFAGLNRFSPVSIAEALAEEAPALIAVVLLQLDHKFASQVLKALPELKRGEVVRAMATERRISSEALIALAKKIFEKLDSMPEPESAREDGIRHINEILKRMGVDEAQRITREVQQTDAELADKLEATRYSFEDLVTLSARDFRALFSTLPDETLWARALKATDQTLRKQLLSKLPVKRAGMIAGAMAEIRTTRLDSIEKARQQILKTALSLAAKHKISFAGKGIH